MTLIAVGASILLVLLFQGVVGNTFLGALGWDPYLADASVLKQPFPLPFSEVAAYAAGYETIAELARRDADVGRYHDKGWHPTGFFGAIGAAAAIAYRRRECSTAVATAPRPYSTIWGMNHRIIGLAVALLAGAALGIALASEQWGGLVPCALCLWERWPYRVLIGLGVLAAVLPPRAGRWVLWAAAAVLLARHDDVDLLVLDVDASGS